MTTDDRRRQAKINPLGTRKTDFLIRLVIYIAVIVIVTATKLAGWW